MFFAGRTVYRKMPRDKAEWDEAVSRENFGPTFYQKALASAGVKSKEALLSVSTKLIYKLKITSLKSDNFLSKILQKIRHHKVRDDLAVESKIAVPAARLSAEPKADFSTSSVLTAGENGRPAEEVLSVSATSDSFSSEEQQYIDRLAYNPKDVSVYKKLGWLYLENNLPIQARQAFKMAVKLGSKDRLVMAKLLEIGGVLHKEGEGEYNPSEAVASSAGKTVADKTKKAKPRKLKITRV